MSDLEELEQERGNEEYVEDVKTGVPGGGLQKGGARTTSNEMCTFLVKWNAVDRFRREWL